MSFLSRNLFQIITNPLKSFLYYDNRLIFTGSTFFKYQSIFRLKGDNKVNFIDNNGKTKEMTWNEVQELASDIIQKKPRKFIRVLFPNEEVPSFKTISFQEIETYLKEKKQKKLNYLYEEVNLENKEQVRIQSKSLSLGNNIADESIIINAQRIKKWIKKGIYVRVMINCSDTQRGEDIANKLQNLCSQDLNGKETLLILKINSLDKNTQ